MLGACGQVEPVLLAVSMPECTFSGAATMEPGEASLSLSLNGLGSARALLLKLDEGRSYDELAAHFEENEAWEDRPVWLRPAIDLELSDTDGIDGIADNADLDAGDYAIVCVDLEDGAARAASLLQVGESVDESDEGRGDDRGQRP
jgi:hypothetical protein